MIFYKNIEISKEYGITLTTVANWINASLEGRNKLTLHKKGNKYYILRNSTNELILSELSEKGRIFKSRTLHKTLTPKSEFYRVFNRENISTLLISLENYREIPHKFTYLNGGAKHWQAYATRSFEEKISNTVTNTSEMLDTCVDFILKRINEDEKVNIIDIGVGDASPVKEFLKELIKNNVINKYIAVDFSPEMLEIAENNVKNWFGSKLNFSSYIKDISKDSLKDILFYESKSNQISSKIKNIVLFIGSTIENQQDYQKTLANLQTNLTRNDYLFLGETLDSEKAKAYFDLNADKEEFDKKTPYQNKWIPDLLNITNDLYKSEILFDETEKCRKMQLILDCDVTLEFKHDTFTTILNFFKGERITVWRHRHHSVTELINNISSSGLQLQHFTVSKDTAQVLMVCQLPIK